MSSEPPPLWYHLCARCQKVPPRPTFCLCSSCQTIWDRPDARPFCAACRKPFPTEKHRELCQECYDRWSDSISEEIYSIPPSEAEGLDFKPGLCARCRRDPIWEDQCTVMKENGVETVVRKSYLCLSCFNEWRSLQGPTLCASCGKRRCVPHGEICKDCKDILDDLNEKPKAFVPERDSIVLTPCPDGDKCTDFTERHVSAFSHKSTDVRRTCDARLGALCDDGNPEHIRNFLHKRPELAAIQMQHANLRDMENPDAVMMDPEQAKYFKTDFYRNTMDLLEKARSYVLRENGGKEPERSVLEEIRSWFLCHRPVHQCRKDVLLACIKTSKLFSKVRLADLIVSPYEISTSVIMDPSIRSLFDFRSGTLSFASIERYIFLKVKEMQDSIVTEFERQRANQRQLAELRTFIPRRGTNPEEGRELKSRRTELEKVLKKGVVDSIDQRITDFLRDIVRLYLNPTGIGNTANIGTRTNFTVFTIVGPHYGNYSSDCQIVLHENVMFHPDFYLLPVSSLSYQDGDYRSNNHSGRESFLGPGKRWDTRSEDPHNEAMVDFCREKLSPAIPEWSLAMAYDWIARVHMMKKIPIASIGLTNVKQLWEDVGSFYVSEGHLPQVVPRHYWKRLFLNEETYNFIDADPSGKAFLKLMGGRVVKVSTGKNPKAETTQYMESTPPGPYRPCGFTFSMDPEDVGEEVPIPFTLPVDRNVFVYFSSTKGIFDVILSNVADYFSKDVPRTVVTIHFDNQSRSLSVDYAVGPDAHSAGQKPAESKAYEKLFDSGTDCDRDGCIRYRISLDCSKTPKKLIVTHTGLSLIRSPSRVEVTLPADCPPLSALSFATQAPPTKNYLTSIWDVFYTTEELPEPDIVRVKKG